MSAVHPSQLVTPPQAGERHTTPENIRRFFDPATYHGRVVNPAPKTPVTCERHTTPENIRKFFDPKTYGQQHPDLADGQKRPTSEASGVSSAAVPPSKVQKTLGRTELMDKFKLAASLNGIEWSELAVPKLYIGNGFVYILVKKLFE